MGSGRKKRRFSVGDINSNMVAPQNRQQLLRGPRLENTGGLPRRHERPGLAKGLDLANDDEQLPGRTIENQNAIADPRGYLQAHNSDWNQIRALYKQKRLNFVRGNGIGPNKHGVFDVERAKRYDAGMNAMLAFRLEETLLKRQPGVLSKGYSIMHQTKRQILIDSIFENPDVNAQELYNFDWNYGAGTGSATSDIDSNLSGYGSEKAVEVFNDKFRTRWGKESGIVFDVNVYARDYLPITGAGSLWRFNQQKLHNNDTKDTDLALSPKSLNRNNSGVSVQFETQLDQNDKAYYRAMRHEEVYSLVKMRMDMEDGDWAQYKRFLIQQMWQDGKKDATFRREAGTLARRIQKAEQIHHKREIEIEKKIDTFGIEARDLIRTEKVMRAENELYAEKLEEVAKLRAVLRKKRRRMSLVQLESLQYQITEALHEAAIYANEAYITGASVIHVVANKQILSDVSDDPLAQNLNANRGKNFKVKLTVDQFMHAFTENMAFAIKDMNLYRDDPDEAVTKASKYLYRAAVAARFINEQSKGSIPKLNLFESCSKRLLAAKLNQLGQQHRATPSQILQIWSRTGQGFDPTYSTRDMKNDFIHFILAVQKAYSKVRFVHRH
ncbi:MAG: hypothetical protein AAF639_33990 [Chloroflexota bacterium]